MIYRNERYFGRQMAKFSRDGRDVGLVDFAAQIADHGQALHQAPTYHAFFDSLDLLGWTVENKRAGLRLESKLTMPCGQSFGVSGTDADPTQLSFISWQKR